MGLRDLGPGSAPHLPVGHAERFCVRAGGRNHTAAGWTLSHGSIGGRRARRARDTFPSWLRSPGLLPVDRTPASNDAVVLRFRPCAVLERAPCLGPVGGGKATPRARNRVCGSFYRYLCHGGDNGAAR